MRNAADWPFFPQHHRYGESRYRIDENFSIQPIHLFFHLSVVDRNAFQFCKKDSKILGNRLTSQNMVKELFMYKRRTLEAIKIALQIILTTVRCYQTNITIMEDVRRTVTHIFYLQLVSNGYLKTKHEEKSLLNIT